ncbi:putative ISL3 family IS469-like transposase [Streptomyces avermitilis MA-4680 = NBRC 14893]|uniref:ISL3 family IS469-like transposase n=1 Tax=Streptomyces avermitilis (strain ATCC 31267 / DSM 46492 / JCM 5070 / NBRC 14893 / NCIMB 12804 / NRRL 8165 / MA-4680) TaxID=227882 RepID=Q82QN2_STRAW|nr:putative ISL3 family IS469-like transposase [Streptomyces avermitilis MA-4680 = NBRC 14893]
MNEVLPQLNELLFSSVEGVLVESVEVIGTVVRVEARTTAGRAACVGCAYWAGRIQGSYLRFPRDLPTPGKCVVVPLRVRRFVCEEESCERMTFAEQVPGLTRRFGRRTERLRSTLVSVGLALEGRAGARMTDAFKVPVSRNTLLRLIASLPDPATAVLRVAGVDEYAQRKGRVYSIRVSSSGPVGPSVEGLSTKAPEKHLRRARVSSRLSRALSTTCRYARPSGSMARPGRCTSPPGRSPRCR